MTLFDLFDLARVRCLFQARAIATVIGAPAPRTLARADHDGRGEGGEGRETQHHDRSYAA